MNFRTFAAFLFGLLLPSSHSATWVVTPQRAVLRASWAGSALLGSLSPVVFQQMSSFCQLPFPSSLTEKGGNVSFLGYSAGWALSAGPTCCLHPMMRSEARADCRSCVCVAAIVQKDPDCGAILFLLLLKGSGIWLVCFCVCVLVLCFQIRKSTSGLNSRELNGWFLP